MNEANELLRSAFQIAKRKGKDTNWEAFENNLKNELCKHVSLNVGVDDEQLILRCTCTPKTYRLYPMNEESMTIPDKET